MKFRPLKRHRKRFRFAGRNFLRLAVLAGAAAAAVLLVVLVIVPAVQTGGAPAPSETVPSEEEIAASYEGVDAETLAGLTGESITDGGGAQSEKIQIGVSALRAGTQDSALLAHLEKASVSDVDSGQVDAFYVYDAQGDQNQQIQDVYAMVNKGVDVLVVANTDEYNFTKIADIAAKSGVHIVAYNTEAQTGFDVCVRTSDAAAADFANHIKDAGLTMTYVLKGSDEQVAQITEVLPVDARYADMWDAVYAVRMSADEGTPLQSMIVLDYNGADVLKSWFSKGTYPRAYAAVGTVNYIKTWYQLLNGGYTYSETPAQTEGDEEDAQQSAPPVASDGILVQATPAEFSGMAVTAAENAGEILYAFARAIALGGTLPEENYVYELAGYDIITNENLAIYYEQVKDLDGGLVYSQVDVSGIEELFAWPQEQAAEEQQPVLGIEQKGTIVEG